MSTKKTLAYVGILISLLLLIKLFTDRNFRAPVADSGTRGEETELPTPEFPVSYALGEFDERFGISRERFLQITEEARKVWEDAAGKSLFELRPEGNLKVNLVFDWRQERLLEAKKAKASLDEHGRSFDQMRADYSERARELDNFRSSYEQSALTFKTHLDEYNAHVARWNESKDHSNAEYNALQSARKEVEEEQNSLEKKRIELNSRGEELNKLGAKMTELAARHNLQVENFNGTFVQSRDFEKGLYDGKGINIYEFEKEDDLRLALVHEFGHAIGLGHAANPKSIMYPKVAIQNTDTIRLTSEDISLLRSRVQ
jgi:hypothetical protein